MVKTNTNRRYWIGIGIPWVWPPPSNSDHQDYETYLGSGIPINLHFPLLLGGGRTTDIPCSLETQE